MSVPRPVASPQPPTPDPSDTGEFPVVRSELRKELNLNELKTIAAIVVASVGVILSAWRIVISEARAEADAGVTLVAQKAAATQAELERLQREAAGRFERLESQGNRTEAKVDALLTAFRVPNPAPAPKDGGQ